MMLQKTSNIKYFNTLLDGIGSAWEKIIFGAFMFSLVFTGSPNNILFNTFAELAISIAAFTAFIIVADRYNIYKSEFFMFLGTGYIFTAILDFMHAFSYTRINAFTDASNNLCVEFWIAARIFELGTFLLSTLFVYDKIKNANFILIFLSFLSAFIFLALSIGYFRIFPECGTRGIGFTKFKMIMEYLISSGFCVTVWIFYKARKIVERKVFFNLQASLISSVLCEILISFHIIDNELTIITGHILKVISFYFLYRVIIVSGLQHPLKVLVYKLGIKN